MAPPPPVPVPLPPKVVVVDSAPPPIVAQHQVIMVHHPAPVAPLTPPLVQYVEDPGWTDSNHLPQAQPQPIVQPQPLSIVHHDFVHSVPIAFNDQSIALPQTPVRSPFNDGIWVPVAPLGGFHG